MIRSRPRSFTIDQEQYEQFKRKMKSNDNAIKTSSLPLLDKSITTHFKRHLRMPLNESVNFNNSHNGCRTIDKLRMINSRMRSKSEMNISANHLLTDKIRWPISIIDMDLIRFSASKLFFVLKILEPPTETDSFFREVMRNFLPFINIIENVLNYINVHCQMKEVRNLIASLYEIIDDMNRCSILFFVRIREFLTYLYKLDYILEIKVFRKQLIMQLEWCLMNYFQLYYCQEYRTPHLVVEYLLVNHLSLNNNKKINFQPFTRKISDEISSKHWQAFVLTPSHKRYQSIINLVGGSSCSKSCMVLELVFTPPMKLNNEPNKTMCRIIYMLLQKWACINNFTIRSVYRLLYTHESFVCEQNSSQKYSHSKATQKVLSNCGENRQSHTTSKKIRRSNSVNSNETGKSLNSSQLPLKRVQFKEIY